MEQAREEEIQRITARFVEEEEAGLHPRLEEYARRYPQYVDDITDFVTYYYAVEVGLPTDTTSVPSLSAGSRAALSLAWERVNTPLPVEAVTLSMLVQRQRFSFARLAAALDVSSDIVERLVGNQFSPTSIPREVLARLAEVLGQSLHVIRQAVGLPDVPATPVVAEARAAYILDDQSEPTSFRAAIAASTQLSYPQRQRWLALLAREGL